MVIEHCLSFAALQFLHVSLVFSLDRVPKKSKISEWLAEFIVYSRDNSKNFLLKFFFENIAKYACASATYVVIPKCKQMANSS